MVLTNKVNNNFAINNTNLNKDFKNDFKVVIFHGWGSSNRDNWFPWLMDELLSRKIETLCPNLPNSRFPKLEQWLEKAFNQNIDEKTILVGHSLGSVLILRILENLHISNIKTNITHNSNTKNNNKSNNNSNNKLKAVFLVSTFDKDLGIPEIKNFVDKPFNYEKIKNNCENIYILQSDNDRFIDISIAEELSKKINAKLIVFHNEDHLSMGTGNFSFVELRDLILKFVK